MNLTNPYVAFNILNNHCGVITLQRPDALNALSAEMIADLKDLAEYYNNNAAITSIIIKSANERAFCAGGDLKELYHSMTHKAQIKKFFFHNEYRLDDLIFNAKKPIIALTHGFTMGGGVGISTNAKFCVADLSLSWAMPETIIGFFPDAGASFFLSRVPHNIGLFIALVGYRLNAVEALYCGLIDYIIEKKYFDNLIDDISHIKTESKVYEIEKLLKYYADKTSHAVSLTNYLEQDRERIAHYFAYNNLHDNGIKHLIRQLKNSADPWCQKVYQELIKRSPTSLAATYQTILRGKNLSFEECIEMEINLASKFLKIDDFYEGIRAQIIDKDQHPTWQPSSVEAIKDEEITKLFLPG